MEKTLNYIWSNGLIPRHKLITTSGKQITILSCGEYSEEENCFIGTSVKIEGEIRTGSTILQGSTACNTIGAPNEVILLLTANGTQPAHSTLPDVEQLNIRIDEALQREYNDIISSRHCPLCNDTLQLNDMELHGYLSRILIERIEQKAERIFSLYEKCDKKWDDALFKLLARSFGFGIQSNAFEAWANTLDLNAAAKHRNDPMQVEAIFFGQAGLLNESTIPPYYLQDALQDHYYKTLVQEYHFLERKFNLKSVNASIWGYGYSTPHMRIARLATLYSKGKISISTLSDCNTSKELIEILQIQPDGYWRNHLQFGGTATTGTTPLKVSQAELLIINTVAPMLYAYGKHRRETTLCEKAEDYLHTLHSECNKITKWWSQQGITVDCAADSQALIQLRKEYCDKQRCAECHFAKHYIKKRVGEQ